MSTTVGIIANPASGKDIRRLVAYGSVFDNNEKVNIIQRVLRGLDAVGIERVYAMPDPFGLVPSAYERADVRLTLHLLDMPMTHSQQDSTLAAQIMAQKYVGCIVTLGGDGTNRVVSLGSGYIPLVPISTGTNNVFPTLMEGTLAGLAAGVVARNVPGVREAAVRIARRLEVLRDGVCVDIALVDVVAYQDRFVASRAIWDVRKIRTVVLSQVRPGTIGASAIGGYLPEVVQAQGRGAWIELEPESPGPHLWAPIAPGLIRPLAVRTVRWLEISEGGTIRDAPSVLALDGEREIALQPGEELQIRLTQNGPHVVDVPAALAAASRAGVFLR